MLKSGKIWQECSSLFNESRDLRYFVTSKRTRFWMGRVRLFWDTVCIPTRTYILLRDKRHRISPWRHVLTTAPYQNNIIIPATPRLSCYPRRRITLSFRDFVSRGRHRKLLSRVNGVINGNPDYCLCTNLAFLSFLSNRRIIPVK